VGIENKIKNKTQEEALKLQKKTIEKIITGSIMARGGDMI
jgi:hypothetical protein